MRKLLLTILIICLAGCSGDKNESETSDSGIQTRVGMAKILPLEVGTSWVYDVGVLDTTDNQLKLIREDTFSIVKDTVIQGTRWYEINGLAGELAYAINWKEGLYYARPGGEPFLWIKYPAEVGDTFSSKIGEVETKTTTAAAGQRLVVPAGEFFCHKYVQKVGPMEMTTNYYLAPGVGLVKLEVLTRTGKSSILEYRLKKIERK